MQEVRESMTAGTRGPVSPIKAFLVLGAVVAATIGIVIATRPDPAPPAEPPTSTTVPTEAEAIEIFNDLHELWLRSYREHDVTLVKSYAAPDAPVLNSTEEIAQLARDGVRDETRVVVEDIQVVRTTAKEMKLAQTVREYPRFVDEKTGSNLTASGKPQRQTIQWTVRLYPIGWRLYRSVVTSTENL